jgi:hypothetical protein
MNLLESILNAQGGGTVSQLANQFGLNEEQTNSAIQTLVPALAGGLNRNISNGGLDDLLGALTRGQHQQYLEHPSALNTETAREEGNGILGHIFGSKDVSRQVAAQASAKTGISESILKKMLPVVASLAMASLSRRALQGGQQTSPLAAASAGGGILGMLTPLLDRDRDGSVADDILGSLFRK